MDVRWRTDAVGGARAELMGMTLAVVRLDDDKWASFVNDRMVKHHYSNEQTAKSVTLNRAEEYLKIMAAEIAELRRNPGTI